MQTRLVAPHSGQNNADALLCLCWSLYGATVVEHMTPAIGVRPQKTFLFIVSLTWPPMQFCIFLYAYVLVDVVNLIVDIAGNLDDIISFL